MYVNLFPLWIYFVLLYIKYCQSEPLDLASLTQSIRLVADASASFEKNCVRGIEANRERISKLLHVSVGLNMITGGN